MGLDMHSLLADMSEAWQRANAPTNKNPTNNRNKHTNHNRNKMLRRVLKEERSFRSIQTKWKANKRSAIRSVLDGTDEAKCGIPVKEVQEVYKGRFEQVSRTVDLGGFPSPKRRIETSDLQGLREPITPAEVRSALKSMKAMTAAGPDGVAACQLKAKAGGRGAIGHCLQHLAHGTEDSTVPQGVKINFAAQREKRPEPHWQLAPADHQ
ncbi:hypothetical protein ACOMHN_018167 [Nucella lapillus]